jgi:hypothetical protein
LPSGLSKIRETHVSWRADTRLPRPAQVASIIELNTGTTIATLQFANGVEEIFDVQTVPEARCQPSAVHPATKTKSGLLRPARITRLQTSTTSDRSRHVGHQ